MDEFARIQHWTAQRQTGQWQAERGVIAGIGDDAAVVGLTEAMDGVAEPKRLLLAVDTMVETVHFLPETMREQDVGYKALAANISDIAAMGGVPLHALISVSVPQAYGPERMRRLYDGLYACAERYGVAIVGGDTTSSPSHLVVSVTLTGTVTAGQELRRSGARPGDLVFVTAATGLAAAGLHALLARGSGAGAHAAGPALATPGKPDDRSHEDEAALIEELAGSSGLRTEQIGRLVEAHRRPSPSVHAGRLLQRHGCRSLNDVSDGLASEAWELAEASGVRILLEERLLPISGSLAAYGASAGMNPLDWILYGGEDYALLGTLPPERLAGAQADFGKAGNPFFVIGRVEAGSSEVLLDNGRRRIALQKRGYNHFTE